MPCWSPKGEHCHCDHFTNGDTETQRTGEPGPGRGRVWTQGSASRADTLQHHARPAQAGGLRPRSLKTGRARWLCSSCVFDLSGGINTTNATELFPGFIHTQNYSWKTPFCTCFTSKGHGASTPSKFWFQYTCTNFRKTLIL